jgi:hypothetical protein
MVIRRRRHVVKLGMMLSRVVLLKLLLRLIIHGELLCASFDDEAVHRVAIGSFF